jgi:integrase/recombinase XerD
MWDIHIRRFASFLKLEKGLSANTIQSNTGDISKLVRYFELYNIKKQPGEITLKDLEGFSRFIGKLNYSTGSQARIISGVKSFFKYCNYDAVIKTNPGEFLEAPRIVRKLPGILSIEEIETIFSHADPYTVHGFRNRVMLETLYSCGLRISELLNLRISCLRLDQQFIRVIGKGDKERLTPIGETAAKFITDYLERRKVVPVQPGNEDILFLSSTGNMMEKTGFTIMLKGLVKKAGITKNVSAHTFRHSFASHLLDNGADILAIRDMLGHVSITTTEIYLQMSGE